MAEAIGLLVECRDEPGVLHRITEVILRHNANIGYVAGGARGGPVAEIQLEVSGAFDQSRLTSELEGVPRGDQCHRSADISSDLRQACDRDRWRRAGWHGCAGSDL